VLARLIRQPRNVVQDPHWGQWGAFADINDIGTNTAAGERVTPESALRLLTVYGCTTLIGDVIATMPIDQLRKVSGVRQDVTPRASWLDQPNPDTDTIAFRNQIIGSWLLDGHAFVAPVRNPLGQVLEVYALDPTKTTLDRVNGKIVVKQNGRPYPGEVVHMPAFVKAGEVRGLNPIGAAREAIGLGLAAQHHGASFFANGTTLSGVLSFPDAIDDDELKRTKANWIKHHQGGAKAHLPGIVTGGGTWTPISISARDAQFLESRQFEAAHIASMMFRVDPSMFGLAPSGQSLTYQNIDQRWLELSRRALMPWTARFELLLSSLLPRPQYVKFNYDAYIRPDIKTRYESYQIALQNHWQTIDEVRELEDEPPLNNGEMFPPSKAPTTGSAA
jgi:HK97 family phage portal protein